jgi:nucleoside phosphorylase
VTPSAAGSVDVLSVDVLIVVALRDELQALLTITDGEGSVWQEREDVRGYRYYIQSFSRQSGIPFTVAAARTNDMGETSATAAAMRLIHQLRPWRLAMCGICAGARGDVQLGDVIVADRIFKFDGGAVKVTRAKGSSAADEPRERYRVELFHDIRTYNLNPLWRYQAEDFPPGWARALGRRPRSYGDQERWLLAEIAKQAAGFEAKHFARGYPKEVRAAECPQWATVITRLRESGDLEPRGLAFTAKGRETFDNETILYPDGRPEISPRVHVGAIGTSARLQRDEQLFPRLRRIVRKTLGVEMEGAAIGVVADLEQLDAIMVKAVVDFGDAEKDDQFRDYAARAAALFLIEFLKRHLPIRPEQPAPVAPPRAEAPRASMAFSTESFEACTWILVLKGSKLSSSTDPSMLLQQLRHSTSDESIEVTPEPQERLVFRVTSRLDTYEKLWKKYMRNRPTQKLEQAIRYISRDLLPDPDDAAAGHFGRSPLRNNMLLWANVRRGAGIWFELHIEVSSLDEGMPLHGEVSFFLHPTISKEPLRVPVEQGKAKLDLEVWGSFTIGAIVESTGTRLELDLADLAGVPPGFSDN